MTIENTYRLIDSGYERKLERFGPYVFSRPCAQAVWKPNLPEQTWKEVDSLFSREGENKWTHFKQLPNFWTITVADLIFKISMTDFGHLGIFPEQKIFWEWIQNTVKKACTKEFRPRILNLFAYSGGSTLAAAKAGASVCHLDASRGMVNWARENAILNDLTQFPIRWIVEDVRKFLHREIKRGSRYEAIILDPPSFGRGSQGEFFKIEQEIGSLLDDCRRLLSETPLFILFTCHTPGFTPIVLRHLMNQAFDGLPKGDLDCGEMVLEGKKSVLTIPSGTYARWTAKL